jgi:uncharacterized membrane protein YhaH (DUF805 family)
VANAHDPCAIIAVAVAKALIEVQSPAAEYIVASIVVAGIFSIIALAISIWLFVEIGFLRGTQGPNRFGPDPLGATRADAQL